MTFWLPISYHKVTLRNQRDHNLQRFGGREGAINAQLSLKVLSVALTSIYEGGVGRSSIGIAGTPSLMAYHTASSILHMGFPLPVPLQSKLASFTDGDGERPGANVVATSKRRASTLPTRLLGLEGRVGIHRLISVRQSASEVKHGRWVSDQYNLSLGRTEEEFEIVSCRLSGSVAGAVVADQIKRACNCHLQPSLFSTSIILT